MKQDRFLIAILIFIVILVIAAVAVYFIRQEKQAYLPDTSPENIVQNYVLALQNKEYEKAYSYLRQEDKTPTLAEFKETFLRQQRSLAETAIQIGDVTEKDGHVTLEIIILHGGREPFGNTWKEYNAALLEKEDAGWKITYFPSPYWGWDWDTASYPNY